MTGDNLGVPAGTPVPIGFFHPDFFVQINVIQQEGRRRKYKKATPFSPSLASTMWERSLASVSRWSLTSPMGEWSLGTVGAGARLSGEVEAFDISWCT